MKVKVCLVLLLALAAAASAQQAALAPPVALWSLSGEFVSPESAFYDAASNAVFVSSINGGMTDKDGNGYISRLTPDGKIVNAKWVTGLNGPKGIRGVGGTLWAADIDEVVGIDIASGRITSRVRIEGAQFLNDLATAPDGTVYTSDSFGARIYEIRNGKASVFVEGADVVEQANGLLVDGNRLILGTIGPAGGGRGGPRRGGGPPQGVPPGPPAPEGGQGNAQAGAAPARGGPPAAPGAAPGRGAGRGRGGPGGAGGSLYAFDLVTKQRTKLTNDPVGGVDGIEPDGRGGVILTDVFGQRILHVSASGQTRVLAQLAGGGADFGFIPKRNIAIVPFLNDGKVEAYDLTGALE